MAEPDYWARPRPPSRAKLGSLVKNTCHCTRKPVRGYLYIATAASVGESLPASAAPLSPDGLPGIQALRPIDPLILSQSRAGFSFLVLLPVLGLLRGWRRLRLPAADLRQDFPDRRSGRCRLQLLLLFGDPEDERRHRHHRAIHGADLGIALHRGARPAATYAATRGGGRTGGNGNCPGDRRVRSAGLRLDTLGVLAALLAAFSFAFYNIGGPTFWLAMTAGSCCSTPPAARPCSGCWSIRRGR